MKAMSTLEAPDNIAWLQRRQADAALIIALVGGSSRCAWNVLANWKLVQRNGDRKWLCWWRRLLLDRILPASCGEATAWAADHCQAKLQRAHTHYAQEKADVRQLLTNEAISS